MKDIIQNTARTHIPWCSLYQNQQHRYRNRKTTCLSHAESSHRKLQLLIRHEEAIIPENSENLLTTPDYSQVNTNNPSRPYIISRSNYD